MVSRTCVIGSFIITVVLVAAVVGIYYAVAGGKSTSTVLDPISNDRLLIKSNDGTIKVFDRYLNIFSEIKAENLLLGITSFGPYLDETIYYATTDPNSVIYSTNKKTYPDLPQFTANWIKTAIAVDDLTKKVYVVDRLTNQINVVDGAYQYALPLKLNEPKDVVLVPEKGKMFVLEKSQIIMADMDGASSTVILSQNNIYAFTVDSVNGYIYFSHGNGIESYDYLGSKTRTLVYKESANVKSLTYNNATLYFVDKVATSSKKFGTSLKECRLDNEKCLAKCCIIRAIFHNEKLDLVKMYKSEKLQIANPCQIENGGCHHLCLLNSSAKGRSCQCGLGWKLSPDEKTCQKTT